MHPETQQLLDREFSERVIRQALLLGFSCEEYSEEVIVNRHVSPVQFRSEARYKFMFRDLPRTGYHSQYSAAYDYMRLLEVPHEIIGEYRG